VISLPKIPCIHRICMVLAHHTYSAASLPFTVHHSNKHSLEQPQNYSAPEMLGNACKYFTDSLTRQARFSHHSQLAGLYVSSVLPIVHATPTHHSQLVIVEHFQRFPNDGDGLLVGVGHTANCMQVLATEGEFARPLIALQGHERAGCMAKPMYV